MRPASVDHAESFVTWQHATMRIAPALEALRGRVHKARVDRALHDTRRFQRRRYETTTQESGDAAYLRKVAAAGRLPGVREGPSPGARYEICCEGVPAPPDRSRGASSPSPSTSAAQGQ